MARLFPVVMEIVEVKRILKGSHLEIISPEAGSVTSDKNYIAGFTKQVKIDHYKMLIKFHQKHGIGFQAKYIEWINEKIEEYKLKKNEYDSKRIGTKELLGTD